MILALSSWLKPFEIASPKRQELKIHQFLQTVNN